MRVRVRAWWIAVAAVLLAGCGAADEAPELMSSPTSALGGGFGGVPAGNNAPTAAVTDPGTGLRLSIARVETVPSLSGTVTVFTFRFENPGRETVAASGWTAPVVVYGPADTPAAHNISVSEGFGADVPAPLAPGASQELRHAYRVPTALLNPARVSAGSVVWQGDFSAFRR